jgi:hypothetical protein
MEGGMDFLDLFRTKTKQTEPPKESYVPSDADLLEAKLRSWGPERERIAVALIVALSTRDDQMIKLVLGPAATTEDAIGRFTDEQCQWLIAVLRSRGIELPPTAGR